MGLFDKKFCDICGEKIRFLGNHKLEDGNMCGTCNKKMSPFFNGRRKTTVAEMKEHLAEREANLAKLPQFVVGSVFGEGKKLYIDATGTNFIVTYASAGNFEKDNPDVIPLSAVTGCNTDIKENREEEYTKDANGNRVSYNPPRYRYFYEFNLTILLNWRWFNEIKITLNSSKVEGLQSAQYHNYESMAMQARAAILRQPVPTMTTAYQANNMTPQSMFDQFAAATAAAAGTTMAQNGTGYQNAGYQAAPNAGYQNAGYQAAPNAGYQAAPNAGYQAAPNAGYQAPNAGYQAAPNAGYQAPNAGYQAAPAAAVWYCPNCGTSNESAFCKNCGTQKPQAVKICTNCGWKAEGPNAPAFCPQCGTKM